MREIKFRAWDKTVEEMYDNDFLQDKDNDEWCVYNQLTDTTEDDTVIFMQYTGLKDKNGKEIYEGDIIKSQNHEQEVVEWNKYWAAYVIKIENEIHRLGSFPTELIFEVIGNIYEGIKEVQA